MSPLVAIIGPTAIGKSGLALELSRTFDGEIVSADSRQVYRYMDIGTAKPTHDERSLVAHHLVDVVDPDEDFGLALYQRQAREAIRDVYRRGKTVFLVGGSGLYVWSLLEGWRIPSVPPDPALRRELESRVKSEGSQALYEELRELDMVAAQRIDPRNARRVIRALEVCRQGGTFSGGGWKEPLVSYLAIGLTTSRAGLYAQIDDRVDGMVRQGLVDEVEGLISRGYGLDLPSMSGLGYRQIGAFCRGELDLQAAIQRIKYDTHRFARNQYSWFSLRDKRIHWFEAEEDVCRSVAELVRGFVANQDGGGSCDEQLA